MSSFLLNLARRGAGLLPVAAAATAPPSPSQTDARRHGNEAIEMDAQMPLEGSAQPSSPASPAELQAAPRAVPHERVNQLGGKNQANSHPVLGKAGGGKKQPIDFLESTTRDPSLTSVDGEGGARPTPAVPRKPTPMPSSTAPLLDSKLAPPIPEPLPAREGPDRFEFVPSSDIVTEAAESPENTVERVHQVLDSQPVRPPASTELQQEPIVALPDRRSPSAEPSRPLPSIRPAAVESVLPVSLPRAARAAAPAAQMPVHVRIGRVEIRETPEPAPPAPPAPATPAPLGFAGYHRIRNYRSWR